LFVAASAGIAIAPIHGADIDSLLANADLALYDAKETGGTYRLFVQTLRAKANARRELDGELRRACANNEFVLFLQPQYRATDAQIVGAEALIRWRHPERGLLSPALFLDALQESPVVLDVGKWILLQACTMAARWREEGLPDIKIGLNLFPAQFRHDTLLNDVESALSISGLSASALELEITENIALGESETMIAALNELRGKGVGLAFDDFGTGYASLSYLTRYPLTRIKIDRSFVQKISNQSDTHDTAIVRSIITMAHNLGLQATAEGVETREQWEFLKAQGCHELQGFYFSKPVSPDAFERLLRSQGVAKSAADRWTVRHLRASNLSDIA
jgi:EAL domain-containing protein (putative c-di-GMP-specific phosphodiesterase class I)